MGMTLVEIMIATAIGSLVMLVLASLTMYSARSFSSMVNYTDLNKDSRMALDRMSKEIRQSSGLISYTPTSLVFKTDGGPLTYSYNAAKKEITEARGANTPVSLLKHCTYWTNNIFRQNPLPGNLDFVPTTNPALCKMVQITWRCVSDTMQSQTNSADVQSMKVVIRKPSQ